jgi:protein-disulfide isomerase
MSRKFPPEASDSPIPGVIPESTRVHGPVPELPERDAEEPPAISDAESELDSDNRAWRRHIASHTAGLRPHIDPSHDHLRGPDAAAVTLVEYGDYQSPACMAAAPELEMLRKRFDGRLRFAFRHFPIGDSHPLALQAAEAAEAAGAQGRFWEMHDLIYGRDQALEPALLRKLAKDLDLDLERFDSDLANETHLRHVMEDFQSGVDSGVNGTPTFFVNDERLDWDFEMATLARAVEGQLAQ